MLEKARYNLDPGLSVEFFVTKDRPYHGSIACVYLEKGQEKRLLIYFKTYMKEGRIEDRIGKAPDRLDFENEVRLKIADFVKAEKDDTLLNVIRFNYNARLRIAIEH